MPWPAGLWPCDISAIHYTHLVGDCSSVHSSLSGLQKALHRVDGIKLREWDGAMTCGKLISWPSVCIGLHLQLLLTPWPPI